jgi:hypothetical protein
LTFNWFLVGAGALAVLAACLWARRVTKRIERLSQSYWELRYEQGQLNARVGRLEPPSGSGDADHSSDLPTQPKSNFVPLSSLRK